MACMYAPEPFAVTDPAEIETMLAASRLGALVTHGSDGLFASHLPFIHDAAEGRLVGHIARANPHAERAPDGSEALVIFQGPEAYVSPNWYPSKAVDGRQVPTWNYEAVHVRGRLRWFSDADRLRTLLERLTERFEAGSAEPWRMSDAPADYVERLLRGIVGIEVEIEAITAKRKLSQNKDAADRAGTVAGLEAAGETSVARLMTRLEG
jgi:transcriptional regulator